MPQSYVWLLSGTRGIASGSDLVARVPFSRSLDPVTKELLFDPTRRSWAAAPLPIAEVCLQALRTPKGTSARDPFYGLDLTALDNQRENSDILLKIAIVDCLQRYVNDGRLAKPPVVRSIIVGEAIFPEIDIVDARRLGATLLGRPT